MTTRALPADCCRLDAPPAPLGEGERDRMVAIFKALGDATRLEVFHLIASQGQAVCVCDITARFDVSQPTISHHLRVLREAGLITQTKRGVWSFYAPTAAGVAVLTGVASRAGVAAVVGG